MARKSSYMATQPSSIYFVSTLLDIEAQSKGFFASVGYDGDGPCNKSRHKALQSGRKRIRKHDTMSDDMHIFVILITV